VELLGIDASTLRMGFLVWQIGNHFQMRQITLLCFFGMVLLPFVWEFLKPFCCHFVGIGLSHFLKMTFHLVFLDFI
jgi:hypothetical protein